MPATSGAPPSEERAPARSAGLLRRLAAMFYDTLLIAALAMLVTWLLLPLTGGRPIAAESPHWWMLAYRALLVAVVVSYFGFCWTRGGRTLGMQAWRMRIVRDNGAALRWRDALLRLVAALVSALAAGLGYLWLLVDREGLTWHDRLSRTRIVMIER